MISFAVNIKKAKLERRENELENLDHGDTTIQMITLTALTAWPSRAHPFSRLLP